MPCLVLVVPDWLDLELPLGELAALSTLAERGTVFRLAPSEGAFETPEAAWLGLDPGSIALRQGPLTVAALGFDPPERSVHFHLSLASLTAEAVAVSSLEVPTDEVGEVMRRAAALSSRTMTLLEGSGTDHALVWEQGSIDLKTVRPDVPLDYRASLPQGDGEVPLRRLIDDSVNLLDGLEVNDRRREEGLPPLNCLWPWGQGFRVPLSNLWLARGARTHVESASIRLAGLSRLVGYTHGDWREFGKGTAVRLDRLARRDSLLAVVDEFPGFQKRGEAEEAGWLSREIDRVVLEPIASAPKTDATDLLLLAPGASGGLGLLYRAGVTGAGPAPFDARTLEDAGVPQYKTHESVDRFLATD